MSSPILSWDDDVQASPPAEVTLLPSTPPDVQQLSQMMLLANTILQNPILGRVASFLVEPDVLIGGMPNMLKIQQLKVELDALTPTSAPQRVICPHCTKVCTIH